LYKEQVDNKIQEMKDLMEEKNIPKIKGINPVKTFEAFIISKFPALVHCFTEFYNSYAEDKADVDNLLKSLKFSQAFESKIEEITNRTIKNLIRENEYSSL
jgi:GTP1/Obg family GTP-binding protein